MRNIICPVSNQKANNTVVRLTGFCMASALLTYAYSNIVWILAVVALDYFIRSFSQAKASPVSWLADKVNEQLVLGAKTIDKAPKIFAARVGFLFSISSLIFYWIQIEASIVLALILAAFALLESVFDICVGCLVYTHLVFPFLGKEQS